MKIIKSEIKKLRPPETDSTAFKTGYAVHWDDELPGFGVRITNAGVVSFIVQKRINGRSRRVTLGKFGILSAELARREAHKFLAAVATGGDPLADRERAKLEGVTLKEALALYIERKALRPATVANLDKIPMCLADWMPKPLARITGEMVMHRHRLLGEERGEATANMVLRYFGTVWNFTRAYHKGTKGVDIIGECPTVRLSETKAWFREKRRQRAIRPHQFPAWAEAVETLSYSLAQDYLWFLLLTGCRVKEAHALLWADVDLEDASVLLRDTKNHTDHRLPLPSQLVTRLKVRKAESFGDVVFCTRLGKAAARTGFQHQVLSVAEKAGIPFSPHDLRRTFASVAETIGIPAYTIKRLLNHTTGADVTAGYIVLTVEGLREPMQRIADYIETASVARDNVTPLKRKAQ
ncbi:tyrosine-type recombinase/integrase [Methylomagnum sp.]